MRCMYPSYKNCIFTFRQWAKKGLKVTFSLSPTSDDNVKYISLSSTTTAIRFVHKKILSILEAERKTDGNGFLIAYRLAQNMTNANYRAQAIVVRSGSSRFATFSDMLQTCTLA